MDYLTTPAQMQLELAAMRESNNGELPAYAWPGGYPMYYLASYGFGDLGEFCAPCANGGPSSYMGDDDVIIGYAIHEEGPPIHCEGCNIEIESAYGDPDEKDNGDEQYTCPNNEHCGNPDHADSPNCPCHPNCDHTPEESEPPTYADLKASLRQDDLAGDPWGTAKGAMFDVADEIHFERSVPVPSEWLYKPSPIGDIPDDERSYMREQLVQASDADVLKLGHLLNRYCGRLRHAGRDY